MMPGDIIRHGRSRAYELAEDCALCIDLVDFVFARRKNKDVHSSERTEIITESALNSVLDKLDLYHSQRVLKSFGEVINNTVSTLKPGEAIRLYAIGELLEARNAYAFSEIMRALKRGVSFQYNIMGDKVAADFDLLRINLKKVISENILDVNLNVEHASISSDGVKIVDYFDEDGKKENSLIEIPYVTDSVNSIKNRLWVQLADDDSKEELMQLITNKNSNSLT
jgi:hypothetical protein